MYEQIMQNTKESEVDREIQMNLFKDHLRLQLRRNRTNIAESGFPFRRSAGNTGGLQTDGDQKGSSQSSVFKRKALEGASTARSKQNGQDVANSNIPMSQNKNPSGYLKSGIKGEGEAENNLLTLKEEDVKKKNDISIGDLLRVKEYSFVLESPLSSRVSRDEYSMSFPHLQHAQKEDLLKADSLPVTLKEADLSNLLGERRENGLEEEVNHNELVNNTKRKDKLKIEQRWKAGEFQIIEEAKYSCNSSQVTNFEFYKENQVSPKKSPLMSSSGKKKMLHQRDTQFPWEVTRNNTREETNDKAKTSTGFSPGQQSFGLTSVLLKKKSGESPDPFSSKSYKEGIPLPRDSKEIQLTMNTLDIKIDTSPQLVNRSGPVKGKRHTHKSSLRSSHLTGSTNMRASTKANNGFNEGEIESTGNAQLTLYSAISQTQPIMRMPYKHNSSYIVDTEMDPEEKGSPNQLNNTFPPYQAHGGKVKKQIMPQRHGDHTPLKTVATPDSKRLTTPNNYENFPGSNSFKGSKGLVNQRSRSEANLATKQKTGTLEAERMCIPKVI